MLLVNLLVLMFAILQKKIFPESLGAWMGSITTPNPTSSEDVTWPSLYEVVNYFHSIVVLRVKPVLSNQDRGSSVVMKLYGGCASGFIYLVKCISN